VRTQPEEILQLYHKIDKYWVLDSGSQTLNRKAGVNEQMSNLGLSV
jgi:hypothetical protein